MNLGRITQSACVNQAPLPDERCSDPAFALANPDKCPVAPTLVIRPAFALVCNLASVQFRAAYIVNGIETDVTDQAIFQSGSPGIAIVGASSGNATGLAEGTAVISAVYLDKQAFSELTVLGDGCCDERHVAMMVVLDKTKSMSQTFGGGYLKKLDFAKAAATRFITEVNETKDVVGLMTFTAIESPVLSPPVADKAAVAALVPGIVQTQQLTTYFDALTEAIAQLDAVTADTKVILLISDGEDTDTSYADSENPIALLSNFKSAGGIVICLGVRAHGFGYSLLSTFATGGFFLNGYSANAAATLDSLSGLKGYICAGNCVPLGGDFQASGALNFCALTNWDLTDGHINLLGNGFIDLLPGNGLYLDLAGATAPHKGRLQTKDSFAIESGKSYSLKLSLAGNQRVNSGPNSVRAQVFARNTDGIPEQALSGTPVLSDGAGAGEVESYEYAFSYLNANGETLLTPLVGLANGGFDTFNITLSADAAVGGTPSLVRFWKRASGSTTWYLVAEGDPASAFVDTYNNARLAAAIANGTIDPCVQPVTTNTTGTLLRILDQTITINAFQQDFSDHILAFTAPYDATVWVSIQQTATPAGYDSVGLLLGEVIFQNDTDAVPLLDDDFDAENVIWIPPACGQDIYTTVVTSDGPVEALAPPMTDNVTPEGYVVSMGNADTTNEGEWFQAFDQDLGTRVAFAVSGGLIDDTTQYIQIQLPEAAIATRYDLTTRQTPPDNMAPTAWILYGSNDGMSWTPLDDRTGIEGWDDDAPRSFTIASPGSYSYYRIAFSASPATSAAVISEVQFYSGGTSSMSTTTYGGTYNCYGAGCLDEPPGVQTQDPDFGSGDFLENGFTPPKEFSASKKVCVPCAQANFVNLGPDLVPVMTSNTSPSGTASASSVGVGPAWNAFDDDQTTQWASDVTSFPEWLRYQFPSAKTVRAYGVQASSRPALSPTDFELQGSNDGTAWTTLHSVAGATWAIYQAKRWLVPAAAQASYTYYRIYITAATASVDDVVWVARFELFEMPGNPCATAPGVGDSPSAAEAAATANATALASAQLNCVQSWTRTVSKTAHCTECGPDVTKPGTATSLNSEQEAIDEATAIAQAAANEALDCEQSVNDQPVQFTNGTLAKASPYPSYHFVSGESVISPGGLTITLKNFRHLVPQAAVLVLEAPDGTAVMLLNHSGNGLRFLNGVDIVFDDAGATTLPVDSGSGAIPAGTYKPTIEAAGETLQLPAPAPIQPYGLVMADFDGVDPNGCWKLFAVHSGFYTVFNPADAKILGGWDLTIS